jgi:hypothetical protein
MIHDTQNAGPAKFSLQLLHMPPVFNVIQWGRKMSKYHCIMIQIGRGRGAKPRQTN